jgi:uncharacterized protein YlaI
VKLIILGYSLKEDLFEVLTFVPPNKELFSPRKVGLVISSVSSPVNIRASGIAPTKQEIPKISNSQNSTSSPSARSAIFKYMRRPNRNHSEIKIDVNNLVFIPIPSFVVPAFNYLSDLLQEMFTPTTIPTSPSSPPVASGRAVRAGRIPVPTATKGILLVDENDMVKEVKQKTKNLRNNLMHQYSKKTTEEKVETKTDRPESAPENNTQPPPTTQTSQPQVPTQTPVPQIATPVVLTPSTFVVHIDMRSPAIFITNFSHGQNSLILRGHAMLCPSMVISYSRDVYCPTPASSPFNSPGSSPFSTAEGPASPPPPPNGTTTTKISANVSKFSAYLANYDVIQKQFNSDSKKEILSPSDAKYTMVSTTTRMLNSQISNPRDTSTLITSELSGIHATISYDVRNFVFGFFTFFLQDLRSLMKTQKRWLASFSKNSVQPDSDKKSPQVPRQGAAPLHQDSKENVGIQTEAGEEGDIITDTCLEFKDCKLVLLDDRTHKHHVVPVLQAIWALEFSNATYVDASVITLAQLQLFVQSFNSARSVWEPVIEPWSVLCKYKTQPPNSQTIEVQKKFIISFFLGEFFPLKFYLFFKFVN